MITVQFRDKRLEQAFRQLEVGRVTWGDTVARRYIERINALQAVNRVSEFAKAFPQYRDKRLKGPKKHLRAFRLDRRLRVEYEPDKDGRGVTIKRVSKHYGD